MFFFHFFLSYTWTQAHIEEEAARAAKEKEEAERAEAAQHAKEAADLAHTKVNHI